MTMTDAKDIITRCAEQFLVVLVEGDADFDHYDPRIHALCLAAPEPFGWLLARYEAGGFIGGPRDRPRAKPWTPDSIAVAVAGCLELDGTTDDDLELALELSRLCTPTAAGRLLHAIEKADAKLEAKSAAEDADARAEVEAAGLDWDTCLVGLAWAE